MRDAIIIPLHIMVGGISLDRAVAMFKLWRAWRSNAPQAFARRLAPS
jgi:hypothetical protein